MRSLLSAILLSVCISIQAQVPPVIQWQKCIGGTSIDGFTSILPTPDGGYIACGSSISSDGDIGANNGLRDIIVVKMDATGNIQWKKNYGGSMDEVTTFANGFKATSDGGYIIVGTSGSNDGDVTGHHPGIVFPSIPDVWVVKINSTGTIQWQQSFGGPYIEEGFSVIETSDGGYIVGSLTAGNGGDVSGFHPSATNLDDYWVFKINSTGILQWQKCIGGSGDESGALLAATTDGGFVLYGFTNSLDGDFTCQVQMGSSIWLGKFDVSGNLQWQKCHAPGFAGWPSMIRQTNDGGFIAIGNGWHAADPPLPGVGHLYAYAEKLDANGNLTWHRDLGGSAQELFLSVRQTTDGGYILAGHTASNDGDICVNRGSNDAFIVKLKTDGSTDWKRTCGGSMSDGAVDILPTSDGGYLFAGFSGSNDGDITGNHGAGDAWLIKLNFPGIPVLPTISIAADKTSICLGQSIRFIATTTLGGSNPFFQWKINGVNAAVNNDTVFINTFNNNDIVTCALTSNSPCVTDPNALSNSITITVDPSLVPRNFLSADTTICEYGTLVLKSTGSYDSYLWNNTATTPNITINAPGKYWLDVIKNGCPGTDSVLVTLKECLKGFYMPTAFTPNNDGRNDVLKPKLAGVVLQYKFTIINRWGQVVFQTSDTGKGWDGKLNRTVQDGNVYVWTCTYQLGGENLKQAKGTFVLIR